MSFATSCKFQLKGASYLRALIKATFILVSLGLIGCSGGNEGDLITDKVDATDCPKNSCANGVASTDDTRIGLTSSVSNLVAKSSTFAEVTGDCYASLYPQNKLELTLKTPSGVCYATATSGSCLNSIAALLPSGVTPSCVNGKFYIPLNLENLGTGQYTLDGQLVVIDSLGTQLRPSFRTFTSYIILQ